MEGIRPGAILEQTYEIIEEIGAGGGGIVFRAKHLRLQTDVVVKKIKNEVLGKVKSRREADILKNLKHPYLPRVYDFIERPDGVYTVMDFIQGENLDDALKKHGKYSEKQVRKWAAQLGEALAYLHSRKPVIIHSDIKPANIMLTQDGNICLIDFNISLAMGGNMESAVGISAGFSPPEQYRDPALYEKVTHSYTRQRSGVMSAVSAAKTGSVEKKAEPVLEEQTELLAEDKTALLAEEQTALLAEDKTALLAEEQTALLAEDQTALLAEDKTELLAEDKTEFLQQEKHAPEEELTKLHKKSSTSQYRQYIGKGIDARSDIYSLGMTFYCLLAGMEPTADFDARIPLSKLRPDISEGFSLILTKMIEENPKERYLNGEDFLKAVRNCHKLDRRYIMMHRKEAGIQIASLACLCVGIVLSIGGMYRMGREKNAAYYGFIEQAVEAMNEYEFADAETLLLTAKELDKERIEAYEEEVRLLYAKADYEGCIDLGETYINTAPFFVKSEEDKERLANLYYLTGNAYFELRDYVNAAKALKGAPEHYTGNALYYRDYAIALAKIGEADEAASVLEEGIAKGLLQDSIYMAQGEIAHVRGKYEEAAKSLRNAIELTEDTQMKKRAVFLCTEVYQSMGASAIDEEIALLEQYADQFGEQGSLAVMEYLAEAYTRKAKANEAQAGQYYEKAYALFTSVCAQGYVTFQIQENMAIIQETLGNFDDAEKLLLEMATSYPKRYETYKRLAFLEADRQQEKENADRNYRQMQEYYEKALLLYEKDGQDVDMEMEMLDTMMRELKSGGWL